MDKGHWLVNQLCMTYLNMADSRFAPCQWEAALLCNDVSHWLGASLELVLHTMLFIMIALGFNNWSDIYKWNINESPLYN